MSDRYWESQLSRRDLLRRSAVLGAGLGLTGIAAACGGSDGGEAEPLPATEAGPTTETETAATTGAELSKDPVVFLNGEPLFENWDPHAHTRSSQYRLQDSVFDRIVDTRVAGDFKPGIADYVRLDATRTEIRVRPGVKFHDGSELTAEDVGASLQRVSDPANELAALFLFAFPAKVDVEIKDQYTLILDTKEPYGGLITSAFGGIAILKKSVIDAGDWNALPIGTGPYRVKSKTGERVELEPFSDYWDTPAIQSVVWDYVGDVNSRLAALKTNQAHIISHVPPEMVATIESDDKLQILRYPAYETLFMSFNNGQDRFKDPQVRHAFGMAIDRDSIWKNIMLESGVKVNNHIPYGMIGSLDQDPSLIAYDPEKALAQLESAGYDFSAPVNFIASKGFYPRSVEVVTAIDESLKAIGINSVLTPLETGKWVDDWFGLRFDLNHHGWAMNSPDPDAFLNPIFKTGGNINWSDAEFDRLLAEQGLLVDEAERKNFVETQITPYMWQQMPGIPLYGAEIAYGVANSVQGFFGGSDFNPRFFETTLLA